MECWAPTASICLTEFQAVPSDIEAGSVTGCVVPSGLPLYPALCQGACSLAAALESCCPLLPLVSSGVKAE